MIGRFVRFLLLFAALFKLLLLNTGSSEGSDESADKGTPAPDTKSGEGFTQADLDRIAGNARKEGKQTALKEFLTELGFEKPDDLKTLIADAKRRQEAELGEVEKATRLADAEKKKREELEARLTQLETERQQERLERQTLGLLQTSGAKKPADVLDLMKVRGKLADLLAEDGSVDEKKLTEAVNAFKKDNGEYFGSSSPGSPSNTGAKPPVPSDKNLKDAVQAHMKRLSGS